MKSQFSLACILGSAICLSQLVSGGAVAAVERQSLITSKEVEEYASDVAENICKIAGAILSVPLDRQTFENTLRPWNRLSVKLFQDFNTLGALVKSDSPSSAIASQASDDLHIFLLEVTQNSQLYRTLMDCSQRIVRNVELDPFQRYIASRFIKNKSNQPAYLQGSSEEKNSSATDFTFLNLKLGFLPEGQASDLAKGILSENADVICVQEVFADEDAYDLYQVLQDDYAHFVYIPPATALELPRGHKDSGLLIASKYRLEQKQLNTFQGDTSDVDEGFFDFVIKNKDTSLGHVRLRRDGNAGGEFTGGIRYEWGGKDGPGFNVYVEARAYDNHGNYVEVDVEQNDNGEGRVDVHGGHESERE